jgi:hypothetical protein
LVGGAAIGLGPFTPLSDMPLPAEPPWSAGLEVLGEIEAVLPAAGPFPDAAAGAVTGVSLSLHASHELTTSSIAID